MKTRKLFNFEWSFFKKSLLIFIPIILSSLINLSVNFIDNIMVSNATTHNVGSMTQIDYKAVVAANEIVFMVLGFSAATVALMQMFYSQFVKRQKDFDDVARINFWFTMFNVLIIVFSMVILSKQFVGLFFLGENNAESEYIKEHAINATKILAIGVIFNSISQNMLNPLITKGKTKYPLIVSLIALFLNALLDYIFVYLLDLGAEGSSIATSISFFVQFAIVTFFVYRNRMYFNNFWRLFNLNKTILKSVFSKISIFIFFVSMQIAFGAMSIVWTTLYGSDMIAPMGTGYLVSSVMFVMFSATGAGISIYVGPLLGVEKFDEARETASKLWWTNVFIAIVVMIAAGFMCWILPEVMLDKGEHKRQARIIILGFIASFPAYTIITYFSGVIEKGGRQFTPNVWNRFFNVWFQTPIAILCALAFNSSFEVAFFAYNMVVYIAAAAGYIDYRRFKWLQVIKTDNYEAE